MSSGWFYLIVVKLNTIFEYVNEEIARHILSHLNTVIIQVEYLNKKGWNQKSLKEVALPSFKNSIHWEKKPICVMCTLRCILENFTVFLSD